VVDKDDSNLSKLKKCIGIVKYNNSALEALKISNGDLVGFKKNREFEFLIDGEVLYCMQSNDILIKYENKGNETEYNPSWANSS
jgi:co-chaperonin GroES (HSP10)